MALEIVYTRDAASRLRRSTEKLRARFIAKIYEIAEDPTLKGSEPLHGPVQARRVRVGGWRIVYTWDTERLRIVVIASRGQVYKDIIR